MNKWYTTQAKVDAFEKCAGIVFALLKEMRELSKKRSNGTLSKQQVKIINRALEDARLVFRNNNKLDYLDLLEDDDLPKNADAVLVMVQYETALKDFRKKHYGYDHRSGDSGWFVPEEEE